MLVVTPLKLQFQLYQKNLNLKLENEMETPVIFKIRSTNTSFLLTNPNSGFLKENSALSVMVTSIKLSNFEEKLQISYAPLERQPTNFEDSWMNISKNEKVNHQVVLVKRQNNEINTVNEKNLFTQTDHAKQIQTKLMNQENQKSLNKLKRSRLKKSSTLNHRIDNLYPIHHNRIINENNHFHSHQNSITFDKKKHKSKSLLPEIKEDHHQLSQLIKEKKNQNPKNPVKISNLLQNAMSHYEKEKKRFFDSQEIQELKFTIHQLKKRLTSQISNGVKIKQQLEITSKKLEESTEKGLRFQMNRSVGIICEEYHTSYRSLAVLSLFFFVLGYGLAYFFDSSNKK